MGFSRKCVLILIILTKYVVFVQIGEISGTIKFDDNEPVFGAHIVLKDNNTYQTDTVSGLNGEFNFKNIPYGNYNVEINSLNSRQRTISATLNSEKNHINVVLSIADYQDLEEVLVQTKTIKKRIEEKGFAVGVIETKDVALQSIQVNELLDRTAGVRVRQSGGLGSQANYILNGMSGNLDRKSTRLNSSHVKI